MLKIGIIGISGNNSSERLADAVAEKTGFKLLIDMEKVAFDMESGKVMFLDLDLSTLDALIIKKVGSEYSHYFLDRLEILRYLSETGVKVFSKPGKIMRMLDRLSCTVQLKQGNIPIPPTVITEDVDLAYTSVRKFEKAVLKPLFTSKARGMMMLKSGNDTRSEIDNFRKSGNKIMYIQKFVPNPGKDLGVAFLGGEYVATYARVANKGSWNTTTHFGGHYESYDPPKEVVEVARKAQALFGLDFTCVDIVETSEGPKVFEVSAFGGVRGLSVVNGLDAAALYVDYVLEKLGNG